MKYPGGVLFKSIFYIKKGPLIFLFLNKENIHLEIMDILNFYKVRRILII